MEDVKPVFMMKDESVQKNLSKITTFGRSQIIIIPMQGTYQSFFYYENFTNNKIFQIEILKQELESTVGEM